MSLDGTTSSFYPQTLSGIGLNDDLNSTYVQITGGTSPIDINAQQITNVSSLSVTNSATVGNYYKIYSYEATIQNGATITLIDSSTPFPFDSYVTIWDATGLLNGTTYHVYAVLPTSFYVTNVSARPLGIYYPENAWMYFSNTGQTTLNSVSALQSNVISSISKSLATTTAMVGTYYQVSNIFLLNASQMYVTTTDTINHFTVGSSVDIVGCTNITSLNKTYSVTGTGSINSIVSTPPTGLALQTYLYPLNAFIFITDTGSVHSNSLAVTGPITSSSVSSTIITASSVSSPLHTADADIVIAALSGKTISFTINGANVLQITGSSIVPSQVITGYAPLNSPALTGTITSSGVYISTSGTFWPPTLGTNGGQGDRLILKQATGPTTYPYAIGLYTTSMWYSVPLSSNHIFYVNNNKTIDSSLANTYIYGSGNNVFNIAARGAASGAWMQFYNSMNTVYGLIGFDNNGGNNVFGNGYTGIANAMVMGTTGSTPIVFGTNNASRMILSTTGQLAIGNLSPQTTLDVNGVCNIYTGSRFAYTQSPLAGSLILGSNGSSFGGGTTTTNAWQVGMMLETNNNQEISVHHSGDSVRSLLFYEGGTHRIYLGRNCGWGVSTVNTAGVLSVGSTLNVNGSIRPLADNAILWDTNNGIKGTSTTTYGCISTYGSGSNSWIGYDIGNRYTFMMYDLDNSRGGIHGNYSGESWIIYWQGAGAAKTVSINKPLNVGSTDVPNYMLHVRGNACVSNGDDSKLIQGPNSSWGSYLITGSGTNRCNSNVAQAITTNGNLHLDCSSDSGRSIYLNYYAINGGIGPENQSIQSWGSWYHNGFQNQDSNYSSIICSSNGLKMMQCQFQTSSNATQAAWASGWYFGDINKLSIYSNLRFTGYCTYYVNASSMNYVNVRMYNSNTGQWFYYNTNLFTNITSNHAPCPISFYIRGLPAGYYNIYFYMSGSNWVSDSNDYIVVTAVVCPD